MSFWNIDHQSMSQLVRHQLGYYLEGNTRRASIYGSKPREDLTGDNYVTDFRGKMDDLIIRLPPIADLT